MLPWRMSLQSAQYLWNNNKGSLTGKCFLKVVSRNWTKSGGRNSPEVELEMWWQQVWEHSHGGSTAAGTSSQASAGEERAQGGGAANTIVMLGVPAEQLVPRAG